MNTIDAGTKSGRYERGFGTRSMKAALILAVGGLLVAAPLSAQRGQGPERGARMGARGSPGAGTMGPRAMGIRGGSAAAILNLREELELTEAQVSQLNTMREAQLEERIERMAEAMRIRSSVAAGELSRVEARERLRPDRSQRAEQAEATKAEIDDILTIDQREELLEMRARAARRGARAHARRGNRGQGQGMRGRRPGNDADAPVDGSQEAAVQAPASEAIQRVG